ncbi:hypothetical protein K1X12_06675 [Hyphomonas sp. WL0036]|uniref:hypothetical protein n=1 Tax=Hyphomonas sediminis TaxID=2866160 RepID=UPI001C7F2BFD|nr:hypothetical protein [Hyphomonas sediminis]MBY9066576.1 hypothetical protein [Hyphomonas sediminis]
MDWFDSGRVLVFFQTLRIESVGTGVQIVLTMLAALLGAAAADYFNRRSEEKRRLARLRSLAISSMFKVSKAANLAVNIKRQLFASIPEDAAMRDYWQFVTPMISFNDNLREITDEEFEFLLGDPNNVVAYKALELIELMQTNVSALHEYSKIRSNLALELDPFIGELNMDTMHITTEVPTSRPDLLRKIGEVSNLCVLLRSNILEAIKLANETSDLMNNVMPSLSKNPKFEKRLPTDIEALVPEGIDPN